MTPSVPRVLLVDGDVMLREVVAAILADEGYEVLVAADVRTALDRVAATTSADASTTCARRLGG